MRIYGIALPTLNPPGLSPPISLKGSLAWQLQSSDCSKARLAVGEEIMVACYYCCSRKSLDDIFVPCFLCVVMYIVETYQNNLNEPPYFKIWVSTRHFGRSRLIRDCATNTANRQHAINVGKNSNNWLKIQLMVCLSTAFPFD